MGKLVVYRYDDSILGKLFRKVKKAPPLSGAGITTMATSAATLKFATDMAVKNARALIAVVGVAAVAIFIYDIYRENVYVLSSEEIKKYKNAYGNNWVEKTQYYIQHPKVECSNILIEADQFTRYIEQEKIEEIIAFIFQNCEPSNSITIKTSKKKNVNTSASGKGNFTTSTASGNTESINADVGGRFSNDNALSTVTSIDCRSINHNKRNEYKTKRLVWIDEFKNLKAAVISNAFRIEEHIDNTWAAGIDAGLAKQIKFDFDVDSDNSYSLFIEVK